MLEERLANVTARREEIKKDIISNTEDKDERRSGIENEQKREALGKIEDLLNTINENRTNHYLQVLDRLDEILDKIKKRAQDAKVEGNVVRTVFEAIETSEAALEIAQKGVLSQREKEYTVQTDNEATAKKDAGEEVKKLQSDLKSTREMVVMARKAVFDAFLALKDGIGDSSQ